MLPKTISLLLICCAILIALVCGLLLYIGFTPVEAKDEPIAMCGNVAPIFNEQESDGKKLFSDNCSSCHNPLKDATGPALNSVIPYRSNEWICRFLTEEKYSPKDKRSKDLENIYVTSCSKFPRMSCEEVDAIMAYVRVY